MIRRYILTGTPGAGKTSIIRRLEALGQIVVEEAATDVIALAQAQARRLVLVTADQKIKQYAVPVLWAR